MTQAKKQKPMGKRDVARKYGPLHRALRDAKMTQRAFGFKLGISQQAVCELLKRERLERGFKFPAARLMDAAKVLKVHPSALRPDLYPGDAK